MVPKVDYEFQTLRQMGRERVKLRRPSSEFPGKLESSLGYQILPLDGKEGYLEKKKKSATWNAAVVIPVVSIEAIPFSAWEIKIQPTLSQH